MPRFRCLQRGWKESLTQLFQLARHDILICSPYITQEGVRVVEETIRSSFPRNGRCTVITNLTPTNIIQGATDPRALQYLSNRVPNFALWHLPRLHAKIYIADTRSAIVTSANLTYGGVEANYEYGIQVDDEEAVVQIRRDVVGYGELGALLSTQQLSSYVDVADQV
jgi:phosphatidylserine/phosphatidylglycerophosphate/cardiolipin synthase-like enzyme